VSTWHGRAYGLDIESAVELPGLRPGGPSSGSQRTLSIEQGDPTAGWRPDRARQVAENREPDGTQAARVERCEGAGFLFHVHGAGLFRLSDDGTRVTCDGHGAWQRYLIGQVLPFAALLQGIEVFHASAVSMEGGVIGFTGDGGAGKTTLALNLGALGATFFSDDVLALELREGAVLAHPGIGHAKVRTVARGLLRPGALSGHALVAEDEQEIRFEVSRPDDPLPLRGLCFLAPVAEGEAPAARRLPDIALEQLLGGTFNFAVMAPDRLRRQFELCAALAASVPCYEVTAPVNSNGALADLIRALVHLPEGRYEISSNEKAINQRRVSLGDGRPTGSTLYGGMDDH